MRSKIYVIGINHASKKDGEKILRQADRLRPDVIFIEKFKTGRIGGKKLVQAALRNPAFLLGLSIYLAIAEFISFCTWIKMREFGLADSVYAKKASTKLGIPAHRIDDDIYEMAVNRRAVWTPISWMKLALLSILIVYLPIFICLPILILSLLLFLMIFSAVLGISVRNQHMMARIENLIKSGIHEKALLVTGKEHVRDFKERLSKKFDVEVL